MRQIVREDRRRGGRRREKVAVTPGHGQSAVLNRNDGFLDLHLHKAEAVQVMHCVVLKRMVGAQWYICVFVCVC